MPKTCFIQVEISFTNETTKGKIYFHLFMLNYLIKKYDTGSTPNNKNVIIHIDN